MNKLFKIAHVSLIAVCMTTIPASARYQSPAPKGVSVTPYKLVSEEDSTKLYGQQYNFIVNENINIAELKTFLGTELPDSIVKAIETVTPETRATGFVILFGTDGILFAIIPADGDVAAARKELKEKMMREGKLSPNPPYREKVSMIGKGEGATGGYPEKSIGDVLQDASDRGIPIADGGDGGIVIVGPVGGGGGGRRPLRCCQQPR